MVGRLLVVSPKMALVRNPSEYLAALVVYVSYGIGMAANDCADATLDGSSDDSTSSKKDRPIASGRISVQQGWTFVALLTASCIGTCFFLLDAPSFTVWIASNIFFMLAYAGGLQNILLIKNILVGWLCVSPLWGAPTLDSASRITMDSTARHLLAGAGFALGVIREIFKDIEDVELDRGTKFTLPLWIGDKNCQRLCFLALGSLFAFLQSPVFRRLFALSPLYSMSWGVALMLCLGASRQSTIAKQQAAVKKSIYILLVGLIGNMMLKT